MPGGMSTKEINHMCVGLAKHLNLTPAQVMEAIEKHVREEIKDVAMGISFKERMKKPLDRND